MMRNLIFVFLFLTSLYFPSISSAVQNHPSQIVTESLDLYNASKNRSIPILTYINNSLKKNEVKSNKKIPLVIISPGYRTSNSKYSYMAKQLAAAGYFVVSIQHQLATDPPLSKIGSIPEKRKPLWDRGVNNIHFVLQKLKTLKPNLDFNHIILIGHSNGGDISFLFSQKYPGLVSHIISLDNLRIPIPRTNRFKILSLRAKDTKADAKVIPSKIEQHKYGIKIIELKNVKHIEMCDFGTETSKLEINHIILEFLKKYENH